MSHLVGGVRELLWVAMPLVAERSPDAAEFIRRACDLLLHAEAHLAGAVLREVRS